MEVSQGALALGAALDIPWLPGVLSRDSGTTAGIMGIGTVAGGESAPGGPQPQTAPHFGSFLQC